MTRIISFIMSFFIFFFLHYSHAQATIYHLHKESSETKAILNLSQSGPDAMAAAFQSTELKGQTQGEYFIKGFVTPIGVPVFYYGIIPAGSNMVFSLWMKKTAEFSTMLPLAKLFLNNASGAQLCSAQGSAPLTKTISKYTFSCTTLVDIAATSEDRLYLWVGVNMILGPGANRVKAELDIEGTVNGNYDSYIRVTQHAITSIFPTSGGVGTSVSIKGSNFGNFYSTIKVAFNGTVATPMSWIDTKISVRVPAGATTGPVVVFKDGEASNEVPFTVIPKISTLSQYSGPVGTTVTVSGYNFGSTQGMSTITFNGVLAVPTNWSDTSIIVPVPAGAASGPVVVTVGGVSSNAVTFTVSPQITSLSPSSGQVGASVTINGSNFGSNQGTSSGTFNGISATPTTWSDTTITVPVPSGASTGPVIVTVGGIQSNALTFTVTVPMPPEITSLSPSAGPVNSTITINGSNFGTTKGGSTVTLNGAPLSTTTWSDTNITALIPMDAATGPVVVTVNSVSSNSVTFTVLVDALTITYPLNGSIINRPDTIIIGRLPAAGNDVGITVNNKIALINGQDFAVNGVGLVVGENTITATMTDENGATSTVSITVYSNTQDAYVKLSSGLEASLAPLSTQLSLDTALPSTITETTLSIDGPTSTPDTPTTFPFTATLQNTGIYLTTVTARTADGNTYEDIFALNVLDAVAMDTLLKGKWGGMKTKLAAGDVEGAVGYFASSSKDMYRYNFTLMASILPTITQDMGNITLVKIVDNVAEYEMIATQDGQTLSFYVEFVKDTDGIWRIRFY